MQMKCFLPEPRLPLQPCTVATGSHAESLPRSGCWCVGTRDDAAAFTSGNGPAQGRDRSWSFKMRGWIEGNTSRAAGAPRAARRGDWGIHCAMAVATIHLRPLRLFRCSQKSRVLHARQSCTARMGSGRVHAFAGEALDGLWFLFYFVAFDRSLSSRSDPRCI